MAIQPKMAVEPYMAALSLWIVSTSPYPVKAIRLIRLVGRSKIFLALVFRA